MRRMSLDPRPDWQRKVEQLGLHFHTADGKPYWDESACYVFSKYQIDTVERATYALWEMCLELVQHVLDEKLFDLFMIPPEFQDLVVRSWDDDWPSVYGRFDLAYDGVGPPKLLEFNADTPTALVEASVAQWHWLKEIDPDGDQFNNIHDRLLEAWGRVKEFDDTPIHFAAIEGNVEDYITTEYLRDTAIQAGLETSYLDVEAIGWDTAARRFVAPGNVPIRSIFKLYPWEWLTREEFGKNVPHAARTRWIEPPWKMILSCKAILPLLHQLHPDSPFLLPAWFERPETGSFVRKPVHAREGANIEVVIDGQVRETTDGPYDAAVSVYQALAPLKAHDGKYPVIGSWVVNGWSCGLGIREDDQMVTQNTSRFIPHKMSD
jgi:glutathionylspermidine synthase